MSRFLHLFRNFFRRSQVEEDLSEELSGYVEELASRFAAEGVDSGEARRRALAETGGIEAVKERVRQEHSGFKFEAYVLRPLQTAVKGLRRSPGFSVTAVLTLALAIGANAAILSIADYILFRPLPYKDPDGLHVLQMRDKKTGNLYSQVPFQFLEAINETKGDLSHTALLEGANYIVAITGDETTRLPAVNVTVNYFDVLGVLPYRGRLFIEWDAEQPGRAAVLTYGAWIKHFGGDDHIIGQTVKLGTATFDLIGVLPPKFVLPSPLSATAEIIRVQAAPRPGERGGTLFPIIRVARGVSRERAQAQIDASVSALGNDEQGSPILVALPDSLYSRYRPAVALLFGAAVLVLLIGSANLAIMLALRAKRGAREAGVRAALGASRAQLALPFVFEAFLIGAIASVVAITAAAAGFRLLLTQVPEAVYANAPVGLDLRVAVMTLALGILSGVTFAAVPAWRSARRDVQSLILGREQQVLRQGRVGVVLVAAQVALSVMLVFEAIGAARAFIEVVNVPIGFDPQNTIVADLLPDPGGEPATSTRYTRIVESISKAPLVTAAGASHQLPLATNTVYTFMRIDGADVRGAGIVPILPGFFEAAGMKLRRGRFLDWNDQRENTAAAVVTESAARAAFGSRDPLGGEFADSKGRRFYVVGVVGDTLLPYAKEAAAYVLPWERTPPLRLLVRVQSRSDSSLRTVQRELQRIAPGGSANLRWWEDAIGAQARLRVPRFQSVVLGTFGGLALGLMAIGVFAVTAFAVVIRTKEMGIRMAIGAGGASLIRMTLRQAILPVGMGAVIGLVMTHWGTQLVSAYVPVIKPAVWGGTLGLAVAAVGIAAFVAAYGPARHAGRIDPAITLRAD